MKKVVNMFSMMVSILCMAAIVSCTDEIVDNEGSDYRDAWVGTYVGDCQYHYSANGGQYQLDTIYTDDGLSVAKNDDDGLIIGYRSQTFLVKCTAEGNFSRDDYPHGGCQGRCFDDSLYFMSSESEQGRVATYNFKGRKIK